MAIDDALGKLHQQIDEDLNEPLHQKLARVSASVSPLIGKYIGVVLTERATRLIQERFRAMVEILTRELERIDQSKVNLKYFDSEEFLTLLIHAIDQLQVAHGHQKVRMLGAALANSFRTDNASDHRKEMFVQAIRDLTPAHMHMLRSLRVGATIQPSGYFHSPKKICNVTGEALMLLQRLSSLGLVEEHLELEKITASAPEFMSQREAAKWLSKYLERAPKRCFSLSRFGYDFLTFVSESSESQSIAEPTTKD